jgi:hypothetical protein
MLPLIHTHRQNFLNLGEIKPFAQRAKSIRQSKIREIRGTRSRAIDNEHTARGAMLLTFRPWHKNSNLIWTPTSPSLFLSRLSDFLSPRQLIVGPIYVSDGQSTLSYTCQRRFSWPIWVALVF